jgi:hypothetical protein
MVSLFLGAEKILKFHCSASKIGWSKHPRGFVKLVEGHQIYNFPNWHSWQFSSNIWRKTGSNRATLKCFGARTSTPRDVATRRAASAFAAIHTHTHAEIAQPPPVWRRRRGHCAPKPGETLPPPRSVPRGCHAHVDARTRAPPLAGAPPHVATASRPCRDPCDYWS